MLKGHQKGELPLQKGDRIRVPRGTLIRTTNPSKPREYRSKVSRTVRVDHTLSGQSIVVAFKHPTRYIRGSMHWRDFYNICQNRGLDYPYQQEPPIDELLAMFKEAGIELEERDALGGKYQNVWLHLNNPSVRWAGSGGYWCEADINDVGKHPQLDIR